MSYLFIWTHFIYSFKDSNVHLFYHFRRNIHSLDMHFIDPGKEGLFKFWMHSLRFPLSVWIDEAFVISMWSFLAQSIHSGLAWHGGELQFLKPHSSRSFWDTSSPTLCRRSNSLTVASLSVIIEWDRRVDCELPLVFVELICVLHCRLWFIPQLGLVLRIFYLYDKFHVQLGTVCWLCSCTSTDTTWQ